MEIGEYLQKICTMIQEFFYDAYGDNYDSGGGDFLVPADTEWHQIASTSKPCQLYFRNLDPANEVMLSWSKEISVGIRIPADSISWLDNVSGIIYVKAADSALSVNYINYYLLSKRTHDA